MDTPTKSDKVGVEGSLTRTPFRERALEEQQLKEQLLLSATPGLRHETSSEVFQRLDNNPESVRVYLQSLSSVLISQQKKNLNVYLEEQSEEPIISDQRLLPDEVPSLSRSVFGQLQKNTNRPKVRKLDPLVIADNAPSQIDEDSVTMQESSKFSDEVAAVHDYEDQDAGQIDSEAHASDTYINPIGQIDPEAHANDAYINPENDKRLSGNSLSLDSESGSGDEAELEEYDASVIIEPMPITQLKRSLRSFLTVNDISLNKVSWRALQNASEKLIEKLGEELKDDDDRFVPDRQNILKIFERYQVTPENTTNDDLFELCVKFLTLEDLNNLEMSLFL